MDWRDIVIIILIILVIFFALEAFGIIDFFIEIAPNGPIGP